MFEHFSSVVKIGMYTQRQVDHADSVHGISWLQVTILMKFSDQKSYWEESLKLKFWYFEIF